MVASPGLGVAPDDIKVVDIFDLPGTVTVPAKVTPTWVGDWITQTNAAAPGTIVDGDAVATHEGIYSVPPVGQPIKISNQIVKAIYDWEAIEADLAQFLNDTEPAHTQGYSDWLSNYQSENASASPVSIYEATWAFTHWMHLWLGTQNCAYLDDILDLADLIIGQATDTVEHKGYLDWGSTFSWLRQSQFGMGLAYLCHEILLGSSECRPLHRDRAFDLAKWLHTHVWEKWISGANIKVTQDNQVDGWPSTEAWIDKTTMSISIMSSLDGIFGASGGTGDAARVRRWLSTFLNDGNLTTANCQLLWDIDNANLPAENTRPPGPYPDLFHASREPITLMQLHLRGDGVVDRGIIDAYTGTCVSLIWNGERGTSLDFSNYINGANHDYDGEGVSSQGYFWYGWNWGGIFNPLVAIINYETIKLVLDNSSNPGGPSGPWARANTHHGMSGYVSRAYWIERFREWPT